MTKEVESFDWCPNAKVWTFAFTRSNQWWTCQYLNEDIIRNRFDDVPFPVKMWLQ